jgi:hypothetical protein
MRQTFLHKTFFLFLCFFSSFSFGLLAQVTSPCPDVAILNLPNSVCKNAPALILAGSPTGGFFTLDDIPTSITSLDPSALSIGNHTVSYHFTAENVCTKTVSQTVEVKNIPGAPYSVHFFDCYNTMPKAHAVGYGFDKIYEWNTKADRTGTLIPSELILDHGITTGYTSIVKTGVMNTGTTILNTNYYVFEVGANGCYSDATEVPITVFPTPKTQPEIITPTFGCGSRIAVSANGHGNIVEWRTHEISIFGRTLAKGDTYTTTTSETLYAMEVAEYRFTPTKPLPVSEATLRCYGGPTPLINIILKPAPTAPILEDINLCVGDAPKAIYKSENYVWYTNATGGTKTSEPAIIETNAPFSATYYIAQIIDFCESTERSALHVNVHAIPTPPSVSVSNPTCALSTGTINVSPTVGFEYSFDNGLSFQSSNIKSGLASGSYKIIVKNSGNCISAPTTVVINAPLSVLATPSVSVTNPTCNVSTGTLTVSPTLGLTYSFDGGASFQSSNVKSGLASGNYQIVVKNSENCVSTPTTVVINAALSVPTNPSVSVTNPTCSVSTGTLTVSPSTGLTYSFDNGASFQSSNVKSGLASGNYQIVVKNSENCDSAPTTVVINAALSVPTTPSVSVTNPACSVSTGTLTVSPSIGYEYSFDNGVSFQSSNVKSGLASGNYQIVVKNGENCVSAPTTAAINTLLSTPTTPSVSVINPNCTVSTGTITVSPTAGSTYSFDNGVSFQVSNVKSGLASGAYFIKVKNSGGCISSAVKTIVDYPTFAFDPTKCYKIVNKNSGKVLDVFEGKTANGTPVTQYNFTGGSNQKWQFSALPEGYVHIKTQLSNKFLTCHSNYNGANTYLYEFITSSHKEWKIECLGNGEYRIFHRYSGKFLSVENNAQNNKARIQIRNWNNANAQKWQIVEVPCTEVSKIRQADLLSAKAEAAVNHVQVTWYCNLGEKTDYYTVQKMDALTEEFKDLKTLNNGHFDSELRTFSVSDASPSEGDNIYRIKAVFNNGTHQLSENLKVAFGDIKNIRLFPNPTTDFIDVQLPEIPVGEVVLTLNNMFGKPMAQKKYEGTQTLHFETGELPNGIYQLNIMRKGKRSVVQQVVIQK